MVLKRIAGALLSAACLTLTQASFAADAPSAAADPVLEKRVMAISEELRCLVCQNQTIADSNAELAVDLKNQVRDMLKQGKSEQDIKQYMVQRYGDFVLYRPPVQNNTWFLWVGPFVLLLAGLGFLLFKLKQRGRQVAAADQALDDAARKRAEGLLGIAKSDNAVAEKDKA